MSEDILWRKKQKAIKEKRSGEWGHLLRKKRLLQTKDCGEDTLLGWKKSLGNGEWGHSLKRKTRDYRRKKVWWVRTSIERKKKTTTNKRLCWVRAHLLDEKKILGKWWGHSLRIKTKGNQRKRVWWVRTSFERKKRLLQTKNCGEWGHTFGMKKEPLENGEDILWREKQKTTKEKKSSEWGHLWREKKKTTTN